MSGNPNPIEQIGGLATTANVSKSDLIAWAKANAALVLADAATLNAMDLTNQQAVAVKSTGLVYFVDTSDVTSADNGVTVLRDANGIRFKSSPLAGQFPGTITNDSAAAGKVGELMSSTALSSGTATVTITIASPGIVTDTAHGLAAYQPVYLTTSGALPTGLTASTVYFVIPVNANSYKLATTLANAIAGTAINTTGSQSGTHTRHAGARLATATAKSITAIVLTAGDWDVSCVADFVAASTTVPTALAASIGTVVDTLPTKSAGGYVGNNATQAASSENVVASGPLRVSLSATTTIFLTVQASFTTSTMDVGGTIRARRVR